MKLITAIVQEDMLDRVRQELIAEEVYRITVTRVSGRGQQVGEEWVERTIKAITKGARANGGSVGDGKIFVTPLLECIRIRTGERGGQAI